ncbi:MAG: 2Fe-2S iron-sulfur cluster-binding protein [Alphaproteobacteria bacterium]|jgi:succinate dehydrogenase/fumarate reductase-like Fe-S protein|nr:2Fe-2S iron-sulfur cluster-binding protein [Alphaproteobacteria bacterium]
MPGETAKIAELKIHRGGGDGGARVEAFQVPFEAGQSLLDGLRWIRTNRDATLAIRYSCINANACKECLLRLDGKVVYACMARLREGEMVVEPLANKPLIRDLVTDIVPPAEHL